jgi:undecaprenyl-diphosphatase
MELWQALILGLIEGLTEYLPVSSTGHLLVAQRLLGIAEGEAANAFAIVIQAGAIVAVIGLYRARVNQLGRGLLGRDAAGARLLRCLLVAFLPAAVVGLAAGDFVERELFGPWPIAFAWAVGGLVLLFVVPRLQPPPGKGTALEALELRAALAVGIAQCAALWPGVSRSLATILGGLGAGLTLTATVEFSFLLGLCTLGAATLYKALDSGAALLEVYGAAELGLGFFAAWLSAVLSIRWMISLLSHGGLALFGWWRLLAATLVAVLMLTGALDPGGGEPDVSAESR